MVVRQFLAIKLGYFFNLGDNKLFSAKNAGKVNWSYNVDYNYVHLDSSGLNSGAKPINA